MASDALRAPGDVSYKGSEGHPGRLPRARLRRGDALAAVLGREPEPLLSVVVEVEPVVQAVGVRAELVGKADK